MTDAPVVYSGSIGMFSPGDVDPATGRLEEDAVAHPSNHYGVYKLANEGTARVYWQDNGRRERRPPADDGLRRGPGPGHDEHADRGDRRGRGGRPVRDQLRRLDPVPVRRGRRRARSSSRAGAVSDGARVFNLGGSPVALTDWVAAIDAAVPGSGARITVAPTELPFPSDIAHDRLAELGDVVGHAVSRGDRRDRCDLPPARRGGPFRPVRARGPDHTGERWSLTHQVSRRNGPGRPESASSESVTATLLSFGSGGE